MKTFLFLVSLLIAPVSIYAQQSINGIWNTGQNNTKIEIKNTTGKILSSENAKATKGKLIIKDLKKTNNTYKGKIYLIRKNKWVDAEFLPKGKSLTVTISAGFQKSTLEWSLVE